jgi:hypothetical protein
MIQEILDKEFYADGLDGFYLTTGRTLAHYNNAAQTKQTAKLYNNHSEDTLLASVEDEGKFGDKVILKTEYGETSLLNVKYNQQSKT